MLRFAERGVEEAPITLRIGIGVLFIYTGITKLLDIQGTAQFLDQLGFTPAVFWTMILLFIELAGGLLVLSGFLTRFTSIALGLVLIIAILTFNLRNLSTTALITDMFKNIALLGGLITLFFSGPGRLSIDRWMGWE